MIPQASSALATPQTRLNAWVDGLLSTEVRRSAAVVLVAVVVASLCVLAARRAPILATLPAAAIFGVVYSKLDYAVTSRALALITRSLALIGTAYVALSRPFFVEGSGVGEPFYVQGVALEGMFWASVGFAVLSMWRPSFALLPSVYLMCLKKTMAAASGIAITWTDYAVISEMGVLATIGIVVAARFADVWRESGEDGSRVRRYADYVAYGILAIHFANYLFAGMAKLALSGPLLSWLQNQTPNILMSSMLYGTSPLSGSPIAEALALHLFGNVYAISNVAVLAAQLLCIFALARRVFIQPFLLFFDGMHLAIFLLTGILFWKWMLFNAVLVVVASRLHFDRAPRWLFGLSAALMVTAPWLFSIPSLGWYDSREVNTSTMWAVLDDGSRVRLPSNFFLHYSVTFAQNRVGRFAAPHFPTGSLGSTRDAAIYDGAERCAVPLETPDAEAARGEIAVMSDFMKSYHAFALGRADANGRLAYDWFPHHIWSNPLVYGEASQMDLRRVTGYELVVSAICLQGVESGNRLKTSEQARTVIPIATVAR